ncbi:ASCH domain-containing protein [Methylobacterium nodulans]|uniref:ASCH domain-containing protein n=1 Tax=Methylobacterium nodulans (strain LMG 21967 / CNCM I-2342 / ORS 2060) TaxID=460265 RepID=B8INY5_METNO|nr:ASCH domain-containing protein [Methylobacterium nodulans]ACL58501.1 conserved hypothetical protein [Methylobacterium nodulans ORS 2060]
MDRLPTKALSIRQPWAHLILHHGKDVENRSWSTRYRGPVLIHAAKGMTDDEWDDAMDLLDAISRQDRETVLRRRARVHNGMRRGGIVGVVDITDCVRDSGSPWFFGPIGFVLTNPRPLPFVPCRGQLGFFDVPGEVLDALQTGRAA